MDQPTFNAKLEERAQRRRERDLTDMQAMVKHPHIRRVLWRIMAEAGTFASSFDPDRPHMTSFNEGMRRVGNFLLGEMMRASPEAFSQMRREADSQKAEDDLFKEKLTKQLLED